MTDSEKTASRLRVGHLNPKKPTPFLIEPDRQTLAAIAEELGLTGLSDLRFKGQLTPAINDGWQLEGDLTAQVVQPCIVTLEPVPSRVTDHVRRLYSPHAAEPEGDEVEMPDDEVELLGRDIDLAAVMTEALALALPLYPRAAGAELDTPAEPDQDTVETRRPFAGLADLMKKGN